MKEVYALEKVHGTSAHVSFKDGILHFFSGGEKRENFLNVFDPEKMQLLTEAKEIAEEWVTPMRLEHVLDKLPHNLEMKDIPLLIKAMQDDVAREARGEVVLSKQALAEIGSLTVKLFKKKLAEKIA